MSTEKLKRLGYGLTLLGLCNAVLVVTKPLGLISEAAKKEANDCTGLRSQVIAKIKTRLSEK